MKRVFTLLFIVISVICSASAELAQLDDGYYRIQCVETGRYISFRNNYVDTESFQMTLQGEFHSLRTISGFENVVNDPGSIIYIKKYDEGWALRSQGYSFDNNFFIQISDMGDDTYRLWTTTTNADLTITRYLCDYDETKGGYNYSYVTTDTNNKKGWDWRLIPVTAEDQKYFGLVPEVNVGGKGYTTFYASIPVRLSSGMKAYVVDSETETTFTPMYIGDEVPANTPVIIECTGDNASDNKLTPLESSSVSVGTNCLSGVMFCYPVIIEETENRENPYWNALDYNSTTMRMIGVAGGKLAFVTPNDQDYMPANKAYLNVTSSSAATLSTTGSTFTATVEDIDMVFTVLNESPKTCQVGYLDGSFDKPAINKEAVNGSLTIPNIVNGYTVVKIGKWALNNVDRMTSITIPNAVTSFDDYAFHSCDGLESFELPASVTTLGEGALSSIWNVTTLTVAAGNTTFDSRNNCNAIIETATNKIVAGCQTTIIPTNVTGIGTMAFDLSRGSIFIPSTVTTIEERAFICKNVIIQVERTTPLEINTNAFDDDMINSTLRVPAGSKADYAAATGWKNFGADNIVETINVATAGTLSSLISDEDKFNITDLTITGNLNGADLLFIREMAGSDVKGVPTDGKLQNLDLSGATIVEGGMYLNLDGQCVYLDKEKTNPLYGFNAGTYSSVANTFGENLFAGCQQLKSIKTPTSLIEIGNNVFAGSGLTSIDLNSGLTTLDPYAFWYSKLSSITIPKTVIHIGDKNSVDNPFAYINELTSITLETGNTYEMAADGKLLIDTQRKAVVTALGNAAIPEGITWIGQNAFCNRPELVNYTIPNWVTQIGGNSFSQCINLKSVVISNQMTTIANSAFTDCPNLTSVTIPSSVTKIMYNAFGNTGLTEISIPSSVESIEGQAFAHNQDLETVISYITNPFNIDDDVFAKGWDLSTTTYPQTLKVPSGTKALYEAKAGWNKFTNIVEIPDHAILTATSYSRVYGEANPTFGFTDNGGLYSGTPTITCAATATSDVGTYDIVIAAGTITEPTAQYVNGTLTITKAPLKITAKSYTKKQGEANPEFDVTYEGFKNNETDAVLTTKPTVTCAATKDSPAGTYDITVSGAVAGNYEISYVAGTLTIEAAPMPEPKGTTFDVDTDDSSTKEVKVTFVVKESDGSSTPTVAISDDKDASGSVSIPEAVTHNGVEYKVTEISEGAFQNNTSLTEVKIPASITSIGAKAFAGCKNLQAITINIIVPINLAVISARGFTRTTGDDVFEGVDKETCILYVPEGSVDQYKSAPVWKEFKNILPIKTSTGIQGVVQTDGEPFDVFNLSGQKMKSNATSLEGLPRGIYIVKGKKVIN